MLDSVVRSPIIAACHLEPAPSMWLRPSGSTRARPTSPICAVVPSARARPSPMRPWATSPISPTLSSRSSSAPSRARPSSPPLRPSASQARGRTAMSTPAVLTMIRKLGLEDLIASEPSRRRDLVLAMIAERLLFPSSKLANTRHWRDTTLAEELGVAEATEDELYAAMDWLLDRQKAIEKKLAQRHLSDGAMVLYDVTSSYYEGKTCPLAC